MYKIFVRKVADTIAERRIKLHTFCNCCSNKCIKAILYIICKVCLYKMKYLLQLYPELCLISKPLQDNLHETST